MNKKWERDNSTTVESYLTDSDRVEVLKKMALKDQRNSKFYQAKIEELNAKIKSDGEKD